MYLLFITLSLCITYFVLYFLFAKFFAASPRPISRASIYSLLLVILVSFSVYLISPLVHDYGLSNRILHIFGGGFLSFLLCFFVVRDSGLRISKFQFFVFSLLIVTGLGVANELLEFFLQKNFHLLFAATIDDTWWDLLSNTVGALIGSVIFVPFIK